MVHISVAGDVECIARCLLTVDVVDISILLLLPLLQTWCWAS